MNSKMMQLKVIYIIQCLHNEQFGISGISQKNGMRTSTLDTNTKCASACTGRCYHISQPSLQRLATAFTTTTSSSRACWQCIKTPKTPHHICLRPTQLQQSMQRGTGRLPPVTWRKSGQLNSSVSCTSNMRTTG